jgi:hypothetical protein
MTRHANFRNISRFQGTVEYGTGIVDSSVRLRFTACYRLSPNDKQSSGKFLSPANMMINHHAGQSVGLQMRGKQRPI